MLLPNPTLFYSLRILECLSQHCTYLYGCVFIGEGNGTPLQYSCLENPMDGGAWWAAAHGVSKSQARLNDFTFPFHSHALEKEMAAHSSVLAWRIPGTEEPSGLPSRGPHRVGHDWSNLAAAAAVSSLCWFTFCIFGSQRTIATPWWYYQLTFREYILRLDSYGQVQKRNLVFYSVFQM